MEYLAAQNLAHEPISYEKPVYQISLAISGVSVIYLLSVLLTGNSWLPYTDVSLTSSDWLLAFLQCLLGTAALHLPLALTKLTNIKLPAVLNAGYYVFIVGSTVLGEMFSLYYKVSYWDSLLHFGSGIMTGMLGSILLVRHCRSKRCEHLITPGLIAVTSLCFAIFIGVCWEIYEFAGDSLLGLNMQKSLLQDGTALVGKAALTDTMKDLIVDMGGALVASFASYVSLKNKRGWLYTTDEQVCRA